MKAMTRKWVVILVLAVSCISCSGCNKLNEKPAGKYLDLALAGMTGSDGVTFEGSTALMRGSEGTPYASIYYGGDVKDHNKVTLYTLLPDKKSAKAVSVGKIKKTSSAEDKKTYYSQLEKKEGRWLVLGSPIQGENPLPRLNPLHQLEELEDLEKKVTEESGAGRGIRILRIELSQESARKQLISQLEQEMSAVRAQSQTGLSTQGSSKPEFKKALDTFWEKQNTELKRKLERVTVKTIYHLQVDSRRNLPKQLAWTRTISYPGDSESERNEMYVAQVNFYGYR